MRASLAASTHQAIFFAPTVANKRLVARVVLVSVECSVPTSVLAACQWGGGAWITTTTAILTTNGDDDDGRHRTHAIFAKQTHTDARALNFPPRTFPPNRLPRMSSGDDLLQRLPFGTAYSRVSCKTRPPFCVQLNFQVVFQLIQIIIQYVTSPQ